MAVEAAGIFEVIPYFNCGLNTVRDQMARLAADILPASKK